ncbi:MAG TPA: hypothetical protein VK960_07805 [Acidimicrobiia bacterium]|nr:hypothetical protein [Acidimicrobiia bacterium]
MRYQHTQRSFLLHWLVVPILMIVLIAMLFDGAPVWVWLLMTVFAVGMAWIVATFSTLTVIVDGDQVRAYFGRGWPRRAISRREVTAVRAVRNKWWYGLGIRVIPGGTLWNVWGLDAVELQLESGRVFRIGTDEIDALVAALSM